MADLVQTTLPLPSTEDGSNIIYFNSQRYRVAISLFNPQLEEKSPIFFPFKTSSLVSLIIEEDSRDWYVKGNIVLKNDGNQIERSIYEFEVQNNLRYKFRNDGRDLLLINIFPVNDDNTSIITENSVPDTYLQLNYVFCVYDIEDIPRPEFPEKKNIKLYFWELDYQYFIETNLDWTTNKVLPTTNIPFSQLSDEQRKAYTGDALKDIIKTTIEAHDTGTPLFSDNWDTGLSRMFYSSPPGNYAIDDLNYIFKKHVGNTLNSDTEGDAPILYKDRLTKEWNLTTISKIFSESVNANTKAPGPRYIDVFYIYNSNIPAQDMSVVNIIKRAAAVSEDDTIANMSYYNTINKFQYVQMSALDNIFVFVNTPCYSNNTNKKQFNLDFKDNTVESIKTYIKDNYIQNFISNDVNPASPVVQLTLNQSKTESKIINSVYSYGATKIDRYPEARTSILRSALFLNSSINFSVLGITYRRPNTFMGIDRLQNTVDASFDDNLLGDWFVYKVVHRFEGGTYINDITAVKMHSYKDHGVKDTVTIDSVSVASTPGYQEPFENQPDAGLPPTN